jgi:hypothetical protein
MDQMLDAGVWILVLKRKLSLIKFGTLNFEPYLVRLVRVRRHY